MSFFIYPNEEDNIQRVNIDELFDKKQKRDLRQVSVFNKILNRIHNRIRLTARNKATDKHIWYNVPEYIFGEPLYDKGDCIAYIVSQLKENGFFIKYVHPNTLFVSWESWVPAYVRNELKKHMLIATAIGTVASGLWYLLVSRPRKAAYARFHE